MGRVWGNAALNAFFFMSKPLISQTLGRKHSTFLPQQRAEGFPSALERANINFTVPVP